MRGKSFAGLALAVLAIVGLGSMGTNAYAQFPPGPPEIMADISFSFVINNMTFPPGKYTFREIEENPWEFEVQTEKGDFKALFPTEPSQLVTPKLPTQLDFDLVDGKYFLSKIWLEGNEIGYNVQKSSMERRLLKRGIMPVTKSVPATRKK